MRYDLQILLLDGNMGIECVFKLCFDKKNLDWGSLLFLASKSHTVALSKVWTPYIAHNNYTIEKYRER